MLFSLNASQFSSHTLVHYSVKFYYAKLSTRLLVQQLIFLTSLSIFINSVIDLKLWLIFKLLCITWETPTGLSNGRNAIRIFYWFRRSIHWHRQAKRYIYSIYICFAIIAKLIPDHCNIRRGWWNLILSNSWQILYFLLFPKSSFIASKLAKTCSEIRLLWKL